MALDESLSLGGSPNLIIAGDGYAYCPMRMQTARFQTVHMRLKVLRVDTGGAYNDIDVYDYWLPFEFGSSFQMITNADQGVMLSWNNYQPNDPNDVNAMGKFVPHMALVTGSGASVGNAPQVPGLEMGSSLVPVLQAQDGSYVGTASVMSDPNGTPAPYLVAFDQSGSLRWSVAGNYQPQIATADGGVIATDDSGAAVTFDQNGNATGQMGNLPTQSWTGNVYSLPGSGVSISMPPAFPDGSSFWPQVGGNPSGNRTAFAQCPCFLQFSTAATGEAAEPAMTSAIRSAALPASAPLKTYLILEGDPGLNLGPGHNHNVGGLFHLAAQTEKDARNLAGNLAGTPQRVSSVQDFAAQLTRNGPITGGVVYFGHGMAVSYADATWGSALAPGEQAGADTNIAPRNVALLSNAQLDVGATVTLHACYAGYGVGRYSIAQLIANQLQRRVYAPVAGAFFSVDPDSKSSGGNAPKLPSPLSKPVYQIQDGGVPFRAFFPH